MEQMLERSHQGQHKLLGNRLRAPLLAYSMGITNPTPHLLSMTIFVVLGCGGMCWIVPLMVTVRTLL